MVPPECKSDRIFLIIKEKNYYRYNFTRLWCTPIQLISIQRGRFVKVIDAYFCANFGVLRLNSFNSVTGQSSSSFTESRCVS